MKNTVPQIIVSESPAILIPISGKPVLRKIPNQSFERVINTRALIARAIGGTGVLRCTSTTAGSPRARSTGRGRSRRACRRGSTRSRASSREKGQVVLLDGGNAGAKPSLANGVPTLYVSQVPAELIVFKGPPVFEPISGTSLLFGEQHALRRDREPDRRRAIYVLISGRWYHARRRSRTAPGPSSRATRCPPDFCLIPPSSPAGVVLASVAGTPQAKEAAIENSIPQTATIPRANGPTFERDATTARSRLAPIAGTPLQYVVNSPSPIIRVDAHTWYALRAGVWFSATESPRPVGRGGDRCRTSSTRSRRRRRCTT